MRDILVEHEGPVATVVFNRPKLRNAISLATWTEIARHRGPGEGRLGPRRRLSRRRPGGVRLGDRHLRAQGALQRHGDRAPLQRPDVRSLHGHPRVPEAGRRDGLRLLHGRRDDRRRGLRPALRREGLEVRHPRSAAQHHLRADAVGQLVDLVGSGTFVALGDVGALRSSPEGDVVGGVDLDGFLWARCRRRPFVIMLKDIIESADRRRHRRTLPRPRQ